MKLLLNTQRKIDYDQIKEHFFGDDISLKENLGLVFINNEDIKKLGVSENATVKLKSKFGEVVVKIKKDKETPLGTLIMPISIWANQITGIENNELILKNFPVEVSITSETVLNFTDLIKKIEEGG